MLKHFFALSLMFLCSFIVAQTIISDAINFDIEVTASHALYTKDGNFFIGRAVFIRNDTIGFQIRNTDAILPFLFESVRFLGTADEAIQVATNTTLGEPGIASDSTQKARKNRPMPLNQLHYSGTAIPYETRGTFRNTMVLINQVDYQINRHLIIGAGAFIPALFMVKVQTQFKASEMLHVGLAAHQYFPLYDEGTFTHPYAIVTIGPRESYLNFTTGYWIERYSNDSNSPYIYPMITVGGSFAFSKNWRFFTEAAAVFQPGNRLILPTFNFSNGGGRGTFDFGVMALPNSEIPILPLLSYSRIF